jgi:hypothetical protein
MNSMLVQEALARRLSDGLECKDGGNLALQEFFE